eukprot:TRINITY_DN10573_c0_g1_i3.p1 TRINITY_DN10573_c0_g1~~TRINITY_DN10573_c0_g1_i3.p1  ORF type:complete len:100 (+),score=11.44 TRINITY_DN10573_c0_g1_i3:520-819(+)
MNVGWFGKWTWFKISTLNNPFNPSGNLFVPLRHLTGLGAVVPILPVLVMLGINYAVYTRQRSEWENSHDFGAKFFCKESDRKVKFGNYWDTKGVRKVDS